MEYNDLDGCSINESISIYNCDCMDLLKQTPDNYYSLAIVDPPYGINIHKMNYTQNTKGGVAKRKDYSSVGNWDSNSPDEQYFKELFRVSKNQIIWGGNYFPLPLTKSWIVWDKRTEDKYSNDFADCELAWNSFDKPAKMFRSIWSGMIQHDMKNKEMRIHPTQKPVKLYQWILSRYAEPNQKILDTHLGSGSIAIAIDNVNKIEKMNLTLTACELDTDYFKAAMKRIEQQTAQQTIF